MANIAEIILDSDGHHICKNIAARLRKVHLLQAKYASFFSTRTSLLGSACKSLLGEGVSVVQHEPFSGDRTWDLKWGSLKPREARKSPMNSSSYAESIGGEQSSLDQRVYTRVRYVGKQFRTPKSTSNRERDSEAIATHSWRQGTLAKSYAQVASIDVARASMRSIIQSSVNCFQQPVRALNGVRDCVRKNGPSERCCGLRYSDEHLCTSASRMRV